MLVKLELRDKEELFTHRDDDGTYRHFPGAAMGRLAEKFAGKCAEILRCRLPLEQRAVVHIKKQMGIEQERLDRLVHPYLARPMVGILWPGNKNLTVVDGNHRYVKLYDSGELFGCFYVFTYPFWEQFLVPLPDDYKRLVSYSGIIEAEKAGLL